MSSLNCLQQHHASRHGRRKAVDDTLKEEYNASTFHQDTESVQQTLQVLYNSRYYMPHIYQHRKICTLQTIKCTAHKATLIKLKKRLETISKAWTLQPYKIHWATKYQYMSLLQVWKPITKGVPFHQALGNTLGTHSTNRVRVFPKFPMQWANEGGEVLKMGGAHLYEENLQALPLPKMRKQSLILW